MQNLFSTWFKFIRQQQWKIARRTGWGKSWANCLARWFDQPFPHTCRDIVVRNSPCKALRINLKSNVLDIFWPREANSSLCTALARIDVSLVNQASNKNTWHSYMSSLRVSIFLRHHLEPLKSRENAMYFYWMLDWPGSALILTLAHTANYSKEQHDYS